MMLWRKPTLVLLFTTSFSIAADEPLTSKGRLCALSPIAVAQDIATLGEPAVIASLERNECERRKFIEMVMSGDQAWINLAAILLPESSGRMRGEIRLAFEQALMTAPVTVLGTISRRPFLLGTICGASVHESFELAADSIEQRINAVATVLAVEKRRDLDSLIPTMHYCVDLLEEADSELRQFFSNSSKKGSPLVTTT